MTTAVNTVIYQLIVLMLAWMPAGVQPQQVDVVSTNARVVAARAVDTAEGLDVTLTAGGEVVQSFTAVQSGPDYEIDVEGTRFSIDVSRYLGAPEMDGRVFGFTTTGPDGDPMGVAATEANLYLFHDDMMFIGSR